MGNAKEMKDAIEEKVSAERVKWETDKERLRNIHAKQLKELKKKIKDWMEYAKKQEHHAKIYKKQLQNMHKKSKQQNAMKMKTPKGQIYHTGTLSRAEKNAIPESQEINQND